MERRFGLIATLRDFARQKWPSLQGVNEYLRVRPLNTVIMKFSSMKGFDMLMERQEANDANKLREASTKNYIWTMYEDWDIGTWLYS
jgi:hypothetical protein